MIKLKHTFPSCLLRILSTFNLFLQVAAAAHESHEKDQLIMSDFNVLDTARALTWI